MFVVILLLVSMVGLATATGVLQSGNQGTGPDQATGASQNAGSACAQTYIVQQGDSLSTVAQRFLGNLLAYYLIFAQGSQDSNG